ncbi:MAG: MurT ligase domain-containing protein [Acutalibacteraceae bacterium]|jgi:UDP-N-acetylmuramyl tripeptide synthase
MRKTPWFYLMLWMAKAMIAFMRLLGKNATNLPGEVALILCPTFLGRLEKPETILAVTGTNGKTTVTNMIADVLESAGYDFTCNRMGGNVDTGITTMLIKDSTWRGKARRKMAVLEIDERSAPRIYPYLQPDYLVCTNLFRDSANRNAHSDYIREILTKYIPKKTKLILNADDLISSRLSPGNERVTFGIDHLPGEVPITDNIIKDVVACPVCDYPLAYEFIRYNHIGRAHCTHCDFGSPAVDYAVTAVDRQGGSLTIRTPDGDEVYRLLGHNVTDWYNSVAVVALLRRFGLSYETLRQVFADMKIVSTRFNSEKAGKWTIIEMLAKGQNPVACSRVFDFIRKEPGKKAVMLAIDDFFYNRGGSEYTAWIYEADFEFLKDESIRKIVIGGKRAWDFQLRLLMAGMEPERIVCCRHEQEMAPFVPLDEVDTVVLLHDTWNTPYTDPAKQELRSLCAERGKGE